MPFYEYRCDAGHTSTFRRPYDAREEGAACATCSGFARPVFSPTTNIHVPVSFRQVLTGGQPGGGQYSWSDFHDVSERELARNPNIERRTSALSRPNRKAKSDFTMEDAYREAKQVPEERRGEVVAALANRRKDTTDDE